MRLLPVIALTTGLGVVVTACGVPETGTPPPADTFYYPVGVAPHPDGRYLYVANAGFDRRYNAGTVQVFDTYTHHILPDETVRLGLFAGEIAVARFTPTRLVLSPTTVTPGGGTATASLSVTNRGKAPIRQIGVVLPLAGQPIEGVGDGATVTLLDHEIRFFVDTLEPDATLDLTGTFTCAGAACNGAAAAGTVALSVGGQAFTPTTEAEAAKSADPRVLAIVSTREDGAVNRIEIDAPKAGATATPGSHLTCSDDTSAKNERCDANHRDTRLEGLASPAAIGDSPYSIALDRTGFFLTHVKRGEVSRWSLNFGTDGEAEPATFRGDCHVTLAAGASTVARHPLLGWAYVSDRYGQDVSVVAALDPLDRGQTGRIAPESCRLEERSPLVVDPDPGQGNTRGLAFSADGTFLYVATGSDSSLHVYDTSVAPSGRPRTDLVQAIPLGAGPNMVRVAGLREGELRAPNGPDLGHVGEVIDARGQGLVYITAFDADQLLVVDPVLMAVVARIPTGTGPHDVAFMPDAEDRLQAWVTNFRDHSLTLVDIDPDSPRRFTALATLP